MPPISPAITSFMNLLLSNRVTPQSSPVGISLSFVYMRESGRCQSFQSYPGGLGSNVKEGSNFYCVIFPDFDIMLLENRRLPIRIYQPKSRTDCIS
jgi:hypothetical protein